MFRFGVCVCVDRPNDPKVEVVSRASVEGKRLKQICLPEKYKVYRL
jgi:hypothetical protein